MKCVYHRRVDRVRYTRMVIRESFIDLVKEKPFHSITLKEVCERADEETRKSRQISPDTDYKRRWDCYYLIKGCLGAMECWLNDGMQEEPEYLAHYMAEKIYASGGKPRTGNKDG